MSFTNKVIVITGAGAGIGEATSIKFAKLPAKLSLIDVNKSNLHKVAEECEKLCKAKVLEIVADVSKDTDVKLAYDNTIKEFGKIDVLVNCAGIVLDVGILDSDLLSVYDQILRVNLKSVVAMTHFAAPALIESKGCVVNIASVAATMGFKRMIPYGISKAAVVNFTRNVALELADKGVRVNSISPGLVETSIFINAGKNQERSDMLFREYATSAPLQHIVKPVEIADMVIYLASDEARSITGANFVIDSGLTLSG